MVGRLGADVDVVADDLHVAPGGAGGLGRKTAEVDERAVGENLDEGGAVGLADRGEFTAVGGGPA